MPHIILAHIFVVGLPPVELQEDDERVLAGEEDVHVRYHSKSATSEVAQQDSHFNQLLLLRPEDERHPEAEEGAVLEGERHGDGQDVHLDPPLPVLRRQLRHPALVGDENQT